MRTALGFLVCGAVISLTAAPAAAQYAEASPLAEMLAAARWSAPTFTLDPDAAVPTVQESGRETRRGATIGGIAGALTGFGIGAFIALFCEVESSEGCIGVVPGLTVLGAAGGAAAGAIIGAAIPRAAVAPAEPADTAAAPMEPEAADPPERPGSPGDTALPDRIGTASFQVVGAFARVNLPGPGSMTRLSSPGAGVRLNLFAELKPWLAIGPEVGQTWFGGELDAIRYLTAAVRGTWQGPTFSPYAIADLGVYQWTGGSREFLGGGLGAGIRYTPRGDSRIFFDLGARWQQNAQNIEHVGTGSVALGLGTSW